MPSYVNCRHCPRVRRLPTHPSHAHAHEHSHAHCVSVVICVNVGAWYCTVRACLPTARSSELELLRLWLGYGSCISHVAGHVAPVIPGPIPGKGPRHSERATAPINSNKVETRHASLPPYSSYSPILPITWSILHFAAITNSCPSKVQRSSRR